MAKLVFRKNRLGRRPFRCKFAESPYITGKPWNPPVVRREEGHVKFQITEADKAALCRRAPEFAGPVREIELEGFEYGGNLFEALAQNIVSQQLSGRVAEVIWGRVRTLLGNVEPERVAGAGFEELRGCGPSGRKIEYLRNLAGTVLSGEIALESLAGLEDAAVVAELVKLRGVGVWTAEMMLIFALGRRDVLSFHDLGIRRGIMLLNRLDRLSAAEFEFYRKRYSPYGTLASLYLWRIKDGGIPGGGGK